MHLGRSKDPISAERSSNADSPLTLNSHPHLTHFEPLLLPPSFGAFPGPTQGAGIMNRSAVVCWKCIAGADLGGVTGAASLRRRPCLLPGQSVGCRVGRAGHFLRPAEEWEAGPATHRVHRPSRGGPYSPPEVPSLRRAFMKPRPVGHGADWQIYITVVCGGRAPHGTH